MPQTTNNADIGSVVSLLNPFSKAMQTSDYVPDWVNKLGDNLYGQNSQNGKRIAALMWKIGAIGSTALATSMLARFISHHIDMQGFDSDKSAGRSVKKQMNTVRPGYLELDKSASLGVQDFQAVLPAGALILAAVLGHAVADKYADKKLGKKLDADIAQKNRDIHDLIISRAANARGLVPAKPQQQQLGKSAALNKSAQDKDKSWWDKFTGFFKGGTESLDATVNLMLAAIAAGSGYLVFKHFSKSNPDRQKYKAAKEALQQYTRQKSGMTPIDRPRLSKRDIEAIQGAQKKPQDNELPQGMLGAPLEI